MLKNHVVGVDWGTYCLVLQELGRLEFWGDIPKGPAYLSMLVPNKSRTSVVLRARGRKC